MVVESVCFRNLINHLNPAYTLPVRKTLSTSILNACFNTLQESIRNMGRQDAVLQIDGWKNKSANTQNVVALLRLDDMHSQKYIFLNSWNFSTLSETGEALRELVNECIGIARERYNLNVFAVITDNASNMKRMGTLVDIWHTTCNSHSGNLLGKSVVDNEFATLVNNLLKEFKNVNLEARLLDLGGNRMVLIGETRWCSHRDAFRRCLRNLHLMRQLAQNQEGFQLSEASNTLLFDPAFEDRLQDHILILDPICKLVNTCQKADCTIADATELWLKLQIPAENDDYHRMIEERKGRVINVYGLATNLLHPRYQGRRFQQSQLYTHNCNEFLRQNLNEAGLQQLEDYRNRAGFIGNLLEDNYRSAPIFWRTAQRFYPELSNLATKLQLISASTAQLERLFSEWAHVHSARRNRLTPQRSSKLIALYYDRRLNDNVLMDDLNSEDEDEDEDENH